MAESTMCSMTPILAVSDLKRALDFYQQVMGFEVGWIAGEPPRMASVCREPVDIMLRVEPSPRLSEIYIGVVGVDGYYQRVAGAGAKVTCPLDDRGYGMRDATVEDPDGNRVAFGEALIKD
jgi:uncharacterized glyoxalase superfamily protein PhnB